MKLTVHNIRRTLAGNLRDFAARASHLRHNPRRIAVRSIDNHASQCISNANFCFQIHAIDGEAYSEIRDIITNITEALHLLRRAHDGENHLIGCALADAKTDVTGQINSLWCYINQLHDGLAAA